MTINWGGLLNVAFVSFGVAVGVVVLSAYAFSSRSDRLRNAGS
jgi:hypothetical protein